MELRSDIFGAAYGGSYFVDRTRIQFKRYEFVSARIWKRINISTLFLCV